MDGIYSSQKQESLYSNEQGSWPVARWWNSSTLDTPIVDILMDISTVKEIYLDTKLQSDLGLDDIDIREFLQKVYVYFKLSHSRVCLFETWADMFYMLAKEDKAPFFDYSVAELLDMIVRSGIIRKPLSKAVKEGLLQYDFSNMSRAENSGDKFAIKLLNTPLEPGAFFITDPFVLNREQHETVEAIMNMFYYEEHRKSDALFSEIVRSVGHGTVRYNDRTSILNSTLPYAQKVEQVQANYRLMRDGNGYYVLKTDKESIVTEIAEEYRRTLIDELGFVDLC